MSAATEAVTHTEDGTIRIAVRLVPRASRSAITGVREGRLLVRVTAAPVDGAANEALLATLASALRVPTSALRIVIGLTAKNKVIACQGVALSELQRRVEAAVPQE